MSSLIDRLTTLTGQAVRWCMLAMVAITLLVVVLRYAFSTPAILLQESVIYLHGLAFLLGIPYALKEGAHVRVDLLYSGLSAKRQAMLNLVGHLVLLMPTSAVIFWYSLPYVASSWRVLEGSNEVGGIPAVFALKTLIPVMAVLLTLQGLAEIIRAAQQLRSAHA